MSLIPVDRIDDPRLEVYRCVRDPDLLRHGGRFIAEGRLVVSRLLESNRFEIESLLLSPAALAALGDRVRSAIHSIPTFVLDLERLADLAGFNLHRGCLAVVRRPAVTPWRDLVAALSPSALIVVLEGLANADNVGGIFRNAQALGAAAVLLGPHCCDPWYRKAIRTSMGASLFLPFAWLEPWPDALAHLRDASFHVVALTVTPQARDIGEVARAAASRRRLALMIGNEGTGLTPDATAMADEWARIPMAPGVDSLNAATAAAVALYLVRSAKEGAAQPGTC